MKLRARVKICARFRSGTDGISTTASTKLALRALARRYQTPEVEIRELDGEIRRLCAKANPTLLATDGVGLHTAAALLVAEATTLSG